MKARNSWLVLVGILVSLMAQAAVRRVEVNSSSMAPIFLRMGKSTVLRFGEKPKKVVVGNQNYYGLEFIDNDVAIQPLGAVGTNLFVYTENHTYGFLLTPGERYDDLVFVSWKYRATEPPPVAKALPSLAFELGHDFRVSVGKIQPSAFGPHLIDCWLENVSKRELNLAGLTIRATRGGKVMDGQSMVIEKEKLKPGEKTKARVLVKLGNREAFTLEGKFGNAGGKIAIGQKYL
jgi:hypothetical protein